MSIPLVDQPTEEKLVTLKNISWDQIKGIETQLQETRNVRLSYLSGILEIMSPIGDKHEKVKRTLGLLLEAYMKKLGIRVLLSWWFHSRRTWVCFWYAR